MSRPIPRPLPVRARLTLVFAAASAVLFAVCGLAVFVQFSSAITTTIDTGLSKRQDSLAALAVRDRTAERLRSDSGERILEIYGPDGHVLTSSLEVSRRLITPAQVRRAADHPFFTELAHGPGGDETRIRAFALRAGQVAAIGESLERYEDLRTRLVLILGFVLPAALLLAAFLAYRVAGSALASVERMRSQAATITESDLSERLPVPAGDDEITRLGATFNGLLDRLAGAVRRERRLVSDASHELRTPLAIMRAELEVAARPDRTPEQVREAIVSTLEETRRLSRLADDLLVLARSDEGGIPLRLEPADVGDVLRDARRRNLAAVETAGRVLRTSVDIDGGGVVLGDPDRIGQVLDNLIANALTHGAGTITVRAGSDGEGWITLSVADEGPGFGEALPGAFERFTQGDPAHGGQGSGLGLAIVDAIARAHGGEAHARDAEDGGAVAGLTLPAA